MVMILLVRKHSLLCTLVKTNTRYKGYISGIQLNIAHETKYWVDMMLKVGSMSSWVLYYPSQLFIQVEAFQKFHTEKQGLC